MANEYITPTILKATLGITVSTYDTDITTAISAASRGIDVACNRLHGFWADATATVERYYSPPPGATVCPIDDLVTLGSVKTDTSGDATFATTLTQNTDFYLEPLNAAVEVPAHPYTLIRLAPGAYFPSSFIRSVKVTGKFGWPAVPDQVVRATTILATKLFKRQESPFGIVTAGIDQATAMRILQSDPDVRFLIEPFVRLGI